MKFRELTAAEIEVRVGTVSAKGCSLLLYKDARCDMNMLDEVLGAENWQRKHYECKGNLFCSVGINVLYDVTVNLTDDPSSISPVRWIWKDDCGTESYTEKEKGEASDSFKRACSNWGIGRELYTSPFIWVDISKISTESKDGKTVIKDKFSVSNITYGNGKITGLSIVNKNGQIVYEYGSTKQAQPKTETTGDYIPKCSTCSKEITPAEHDYSVKLYKQVLCRTCQAKVKK